MRWQERKQGTSQSGIMTGHPLFLTMKRIAILKATCNKLLMFLTRIERVSEGPEPSGLSIILQEQMGMTGCRKTMLRIAAYHRLNPRCIDVLLHTRMSHAGRTTSGWTSILRRPEWNGDFEPSKTCCRDRYVFRSVTPAKVPLVRIELTMDLSPARVLSPPHIPVLLQRHEYSRRELNPH